MFAYLVSGPDPHSDNGYWEVLVLADNVKDARADVIGHMKDIGRKDLKVPPAKAFRKNDITRGILHSTVQS